MGLPRFLERHSFGVLLSLARHECPKSNRKTKLRDRFATTDPTQSDDLAARRITSVKNSSHLNGMGLMTALVSSRSPRRAASGRLSLGCRIETESHSTFRLPVNGVTCLVRTMKLSKPIMSIWRTLPIVFALFSLCVSDTEGPRLLPLPGTIAEVALNKDGPETAGDFDSRRQSNRIQMVGGTQASPRDRSNQDQTATHAFQGFTQLRSIRTHTISKNLALFPKTPQSATPPGRAPPRHDS